MAEGKIWEVGEDPRDQKAVCRQTLGDGQGLWAVIHEAGDCAQQHGKNQHDFLLSCPGPAVTSLQGRDVKTY